MSVIAYVAVGSNLGDRVANCRAAVRYLVQHPEIRLRRGSGLYESDPVGPVIDQPRFVNGVVELETLLDPDALLDVLLDVEASMGRDRSGPDKGPRVVDLDLLIYGDLVYDSPELTVPHPGLGERRFVLVPLLELAPDLAHPRTLEPLADLVEGSVPPVVERIPGATIEVLP